MGELIVITGPPGAGKTTVANLLSSSFELSAHVAGDEFFSFIDKGYLAPWTKAAHRQNEVVVEAAAAAAGRLAAGGYTVVYDGVIGPWFLDRFGRAAGLPRLHYAVLLPPERSCLNRVATRIGHGFTDLDAAANLYADFAKAFIDPRHIITGGDTPAAQAAHLRQLMRDGSIVRLVKPSDRSGHRIVLDGQPQRDPILAAGQRCEPRR